MTQGKEQARSIQSSLYRPAGFYMLRAPTLSAHTFTSISTGVLAGLNEAQKEPDIPLEEARRRIYDVLKTLSADSLVQQALMVASTDMFEGLERIQQSARTQRRVEHTYSGVLRYLVRMCTRPTPFGLFSGVAVGRFGEHSTVQMGKPAVENTRTRPDMSWLLAIIEQIEEDPELLPQMTVVANRTAYIAGARAIIPYADVYGKGDNRSIALRATTVVQHVLQKAQEPVAYHALRQEMLSVFPAATEQQMDGLLLQLWKHRFLTSNLRPPLTSAAPEKYILEHLQKIPEVGATTTQLAEIVKVTAEIDRRGPGAAITLLKNLVERQEQLVANQKGQSFQVDSALNLEAPQLCNEIGEAVAEAAEVLLQMTQNPRGLHHLREYALAFNERYGASAEVSLLNLLSPEVGLGAPSSYTQPPRDYQLPPLPPPGTQARDSVICSMLAEALFKQEIEVELTDSLLQQLRQWTPQPENPPPATLEMYLQLHATSRKAIDQGEWRGVLSPMSLVYGGRTFCRFFDVLGDEGLKMLQEYIREEEQLSPDTIFAELSYLPTTGHGANVAIRPALRSYEIALNTTPSVPLENTLPLHDLVVGIKGEYFYIRSLSRKKEVVVTQSHMLNTMYAPNICRFLLEVSQDGRPMPSSFDWGAARNAPFLPRVVRKKMILSPAQWNVRPAMIELAGSGSEETRFFAGVQRWREQWCVPRFVYMTQIDNRLLLDLEQPLLVAELHEELKKNEYNLITLQELLPDFEHLWLRDKQNAPYFAELVVPLIVHAGAQQSIVEHNVNHSGQHEYPQHLISDQERSFLAGDEWTFLKLYVTSKQHDEVITGPLREVVSTMQEQQLIDQWFFIRYTDPEPHLRVRFHACNEQTKNAVLFNALAWARQLVHGGLIRNFVLDTYVREIERYGGPRAIDVMEKVFCANSVVISEIVAAMYTGNITLEPLAVAVFTLDQFFEMWGLDISRRLAYIQEQTEKNEAKEGFRSKRQLFCELLVPWDPDYDPAVRVQREQLRQLCLNQQPLLQRASAHIKALAEQHELWIQEQQLLGSLAHMHFNRLLGISNEEERKAYAFWRHTLESILRRPAKKGEKGARKHEKVSL